MYYRSAGSTVRGASFDAASIGVVWRKGIEIPGWDPNVWRRDACGAVMKWSDHGKTNEQGWEIDHKIPVSAGGTDDLWNLQPLNWRNNRSKSDNYPYWACTVPAPATLKT
jgi:hypothetical protein